MESVDAVSEKTTVVSRDLSQFVLPVLAANAQEMAAHDDVLAQMDKASGGKTVWRQLSP